MRFLEAIDLYIQIRILSKWRSFLCGISLCYILQYKYFLCCCCCCCFLSLLSLSLSPLFWSLSQHSTYESEKFHQDDDGLDKNDRSSAVLEWFWSGWFGIAHFICFLAILGAWPSEVGKGPIRRREKIRRILSYWVPTPICESWGGYSESCPIKGGCILQLKAK